MRRREFNYAIAGLAMGRRSMAEEAAGGITDVQGIRVGHFTDSRRPTGCTVLIFDKGATAGVLLFLIVRAVLKREAERRWIPHAAHQTALPVKLPT